MDKYHENPDYRLISNLETQREDRKSGVWEQESHHHTNITCKGTKTKGDGHLDKANIFLILFFFLNIIIPNTAPIAAIRTTLKQKHPSHLSR